MKEDTLGNVKLAFERLEQISPGKVEAKINNSDRNPHRWGITLWNLFGNWYATDNNLARAINKAIFEAEQDNFNM